MKPILYGYEYSVYCRIVLAVCHEKGVPVDWVEVNPFTEPVGYREHHPFNRVPALQHEDFALYETTAICRYIDDVFPGRSLQPNTLQPTDLRQRARMAQIIAVVDAYVYWPLVRQVFSHRVFGPRMGEPVDEAEIQAGLAAAKPILAALEGLASGEAYIVGSQITLADFHLGAMIDYFVAAGEGARMLQDYPKLSEWWSGLKGRDSMIDTNPLKNPG